AEGSCLDLQRTPQEPLSLRILAVHPVDPSQNGQVMGHVRMVIAKDLFADRYRTPEQRLRLVELGLPHVNCSNNAEGIRIVRVVDSELRLRSRLELLCFHQRRSVVSALKELYDRFDFGPRAHVHVGLLRGHWADNADAHPQANEAGSDKQSLLWHQVSPRRLHGTIEARYPKQ